jgi:ferredoxin-NADP reductase
MIIEDNGKLRDSQKVAWAEKVTEIRQKKDTWTVIAELVKVWTEIAPEDEAAMKVNVEQYRETLTDKAFGQTTHGRHQDRRFVLAFPRSLMLMIRTQYDSIELPMDKAFFQKFGEKYPAFRIAEKK